MSNYKCPKCGGNLFLYKQVILASAINEDRSIDYSTEEEVDVDNVYIMCSRCGYDNNDVEIEYGLKDDFAVWKDEEE